MILISLTTKFLLYLEKGQNISLNKTAGPQIKNCWENTGTFALLLILFLCHQTLWHAGDETKSTGMSTVPSTGQ